MLHGAYVKHARDRSDRRPLADNHMAEVLGKLMPGGKLHRRRPRAKYGMRPPRHYVLDTLHECRRAFLKAQRISTYAWPEVEGGP